MRLWTWAEINEKVRRDTENQDKDFIDDDEMLGYANEAIDDCEALILSIYEDYFLSEDTVSMVSGVKECDMPADIYANKIREVMYSSGAETYKVNPITNLSEIPDIAASDRYRFLIINLPTGRKFRIYPAPRATDSTSMTRKYLRNANRLEEDADECDIPEFINFVLQHMKLRCYEKEESPKMMKAEGDLEKIRKLMIDTLTQMVPTDSQSEIPADYSFYNDFDIGNFR